MKTKQTQPLFHKDFMLMVIGQIISLFGNTILRFALPLYLLNQTGSPALLGLVSAVSFIPMIILSPVGGIIADRVNKRNIMVALDLATCAITLAFLLIYQQASLVPVMVITLMLLYGIQGAYQPAVQAAVPAMMREDQLMPANATITLVDSLANLIGPALGGVLFSFAGLSPIVAISVVCFFLSAVMEIFIKIPHTRAPGGENALQVVKSDLGESVRFFREKPIIAKGVLMVAAFNIFLTTMFMVGMPVLITQVLPFSESLGNQLYGYAQAIMAVGGLLGGLLAGVLAKKTRYESIWKFLLAASLCPLPIAFALFAGLAPMVTWAIIAASTLLLMMMATMFQIQIISFTQLVTPSDLIGKVISVIMAICMCAQPIGQAMYGLLFDRFLTSSWGVVLFSAIASILVSYASRRTFARVNEVLPEAAPTQANAAPAPAGS